jgi:DNA repair exonuclease SbcCD ATPase subunit
MSSLDFDLDSQMSNLESEWRQAYETSIGARAELQALLEGPKSRSAIIGRAQMRVERAEASKARIMAKIERLENTLLGRDP